MIERERRFLVGELPDVLPEPDHIEQGFLTTSPAAVRVRRRSGSFTLTIKTGRGLSRTEIERDLSAEEFDALWAVADDLRIEKHRYLLSLDTGHTAELDLFDGELAGKRIVEVEFETDQAAAAFEPPVWFGREVTHDGRYTNAALARHGWPTDDD
jgi:CYTH domain-containing protein